MARYIRFNQRIGKNLRQLRCDRHETQQALANVIGRHRPAISEVEAGKRALTLPEAVLLTNHLRYSLVTLLANTGHPAVSRPDPEST